jgi:hypothetical protein
MKRFVAITAALSLCALYQLAATASAAAPSATTGSASGVNASSASVNGTVNPNGEGTTYAFQFGTTTAYGLQTNPRSAGSGTQDQSVSATLTGLTAGTTYHYRLIATNASGTTVGTDRTFTTSGSPPPPPSSSPPTAATGAAVAVGQSRATVRGTVNPRGAQTTYYFEYGLTAAYGAQSNARSLSAGNSARSVSAILTGLQAGQTYHYRLVARNASGLNVGADRTFTTSPASAVGSVPRLTSRVTPFRDRRRPFRFTVRGRVIRPAGVSRASGCRGRVTIRFKARRKTIRLRRARVNSSCRYRARVRVRVRRTPRILRVSARFGGNAALDARSARTRKVRVG